MLVAYYAAQIAGGIVIGVLVAVGYMAIRGTTSPNVVADVQRAVVVPASLTGMVLGGLVAFRIARRSLPGPIGSGALSSIGWSRASPRDLLVAILAGSGLAMLYLFGLNAAFSPAPDQQLGPLVSAAGSGGWPRHGWALLAVLIAPPIEEFVFRGVLFTGLSRSWTAGSSAALVMVLFVASHLSEVFGYAPALIAIALVGGATLVARMVTKSLIQAIALHASYNLGLVVAVYAGAA